MQNYPKQTNPRRLHILVIHPKFSVFGGAENAAIEMMRSWRRLGHRVTVVSARFSKEVRKVFDSEGIKIKSIYIPFVPADDLEKRNLALVGWLIKFKRVFKGVDIVNIHNSPSNFWLLYASQFGRHQLPPVIWTCHEPSRSRYQDVLGDDSPSWQFTGDPTNPIHIPDEYQHKDPLRSLDRQSIEFITEIHANSQQTSRNISLVYRKNAVLNYIGVPLSKSDDLAKLQSYHNIKRHRSQPVFTMVTRLEPAKNIHIFLQALADIQNRDPDLHKKMIVYIIGTGPIYLDLLDFSEKIGVPWVDFLGWVSDSEKQDYVGKSDCLVYLPICEPLGLVPLEGARWGTPTIGSREGGLLETIIDHKTGLLVDPRNTAEVAQALVWAMGHKEQLISMGLSAFDHVQKNFSIDQTAERFLESAYRLIGQ